MSEEEITTAAVMLQPKLFHVITCAGHELLLLREIDAFTKKRHLLLDRLGYERIGKREHEHDFDGRDEQVDFGIVTPQVVDLILHKENHSVGRVAHLREILPVGERDEERRGAHIYQQHVLVDLFHLRRRRTLLLR